ncbi:hypothetical protein LTR53_002409 [Teratosphaeriaceae sp. CCFEE 6253]|nr:hypothetical protein LTR53_002409 [Teratosphaeriaceae sp. CCFEE 6253]
MGVLDYLDIKNANRIGLSIHDPFAVFSFACLGLLVLLALFLLTFTARRSADDVWDAAHMVRGPHHHDPAYKRHRKSVWSLSNSSRSKRSSASSSGSGTLRPNSRRQSSLSLLPHAEDERGPEREPELVFSPQAVLGRFSAAQASQVALLSTSMSAEYLPLGHPRQPDRAELPVELPTEMV